jgi:hypothetical protein
MAEQLPTENLHGETRMSTPEFRTGQDVTNARGWHGKVTKIEHKPDSYQPDKLYVSVYWKERESHHDKHVAKQPIIGHPTSQLFPGTDRDAILDKLKQSSA